MPSTPSHHRPGNRLLAWAIGAAVAFMLLGFGLAAALGYEDEARFRAIVETLESEHGRAAAGVALALLLALDLFLPLPSSALQMLAGHFFGTALGGAIGFSGSFASAVIGFALCRRFGIPAFARLCGEQETARLARSLARLSPWLVLATRGAPMLAELAACLAGLAAFPTSRFLLCVGLGAAPVAWIYAAAGAHAREASGAALLSGILLPIAGFALGAWALGRRGSDPGDRQPLERRRSLD